MAEPVRRTSRVAMPTVPDRSEQAFFWQRQFSPQITPSQVGFDLAFGIVLPLICLSLDPFVLRSPAGRALIGQYTIVVGMAGGLGIVLLPAWHLSRRPPAVFAGLMSGTAIFATLLGVVLLPFSVVGLCFDKIAVLGFSPFATAFVFWRNAIRAYQQACEMNSEARVQVFTAIGLLLTCGSPWVVDGCFAHEFSRAAEMSLSADPTEAARGITALKQFRWLPNLAQLVDSDRLVADYEAEKDPERRQRLVALHKELTGEGIEERLARLRD